MRKLGSKPTALIPTTHSLLDCILDLHLNTLACGLIFRHIGCLRCLPWLHGVKQQKVARPESRTSLAECDTGTARQQLLAQQLENVWRIDVATSSLLWSVRNIVAHPRARGLHYWLSGSPKREWSPPPSSEELLALGSFCARPYPDDDIIYGNEFCSVMKILQFNWQR
jgi:hypothetical protein